MKKRIMKRSETSGRADDNEETIGKRLKTFTNQTMPVLEYYKGMKKLQEVRGEEKERKRKREREREIGEEEERRRWLG